MRRLSHSEMKMWQRCRRKWWLSSYRNLVPLQEKKSGAAALGTRVHEALEVMYEVSDDAALATLAAGIEADAAAFPEQADQIRKDGDMAMAMVEGYIQWSAEDGVDQDLEIIDVEAKIAVKLPDSPVTLVGKLDQRARRKSDGARVFVDHKTVDDFSRVALLKQDTQMKHYHLMEFLKLLEEGVPPEEAVEVRTGGAYYNMLRKVKRTGRAKPPFYMREYVGHNMDDLRSYFFHVWAVAAEIIEAELALDAGQDHHLVAYPNPTRDCSWDCDFQAVCPMFDDGSDAEGMVEMIYRKGNYMSRYDDDSRPKN